MLNDSETSLMSKEILPYGQKQRSTERRVVNDKEIAKITFIIPPTTIILFLTYNPIRLLSSIRFSPGFLTSVFLFLPLSVWAYYMAFEKGLLTPVFMLISLIGGFIIMSFPILLQIIKKKMNY